MSNAIQLMTFLASKTSQLDIWFLSIWYHSYTNADKRSQVRVKLFFLVDRYYFQQLKNTHDLASDLQNFHVLVAQSYWDKQKNF